MKIDLITGRKLYASCKFGMSYEIEDLLVKYCNAKLIYPQPRRIYKSSISNSSLFSRFILKLMRETKGYFTPITVDKASESGPRVLGIVALTGADLFLASAIKNWRQHYDIVFAYVIDCWMYDTYPKFTQQFDHLFIPYPEFQHSLQERLLCPISVIPLAANNLRYGFPSISRSVDVISYGRTASNYDKTLFNDFDSNHPESFYYRFGVGTSAKVEKNPDLDWGQNRFDYQHRITLSRVLKRSKIALAFQNLYTRVVNEGSSHVINKASNSLLTLRWFECSGAGCAVVGKRPSSPLLEKFMGWEDATIELPDDVNAGIDMIHRFLKDKDRLAVINQRNYLQNVALNDWSYRFKAMLDILELPTPEPLSVTLGKLDQIYCSKKKELGFKTYKI